MHSSTCLCGERRGSFSDGSTLYEPTLFLLAGVDQAVTAERVGACICWLLSFTYLLASVDAVCHFNPMS